MEKSNGCKSKKYGYLYLHRIRLLSASENLSNEILEAFDFINDHAHAFFMNNRPWTDDDCYYVEFVDEDNEYCHTRDYTLKKGGLHIDQKFIYVFDFRDDWIFRCSVLRIPE